MRETQGTNPGVHGPPLATGRSSLPHRRFDTPVPLGYAGLRCTTRLPSRGSWASRTTRTPVPAGRRQSPAGPRRRPGIWRASKGSSRRSATLTSDAPRSTSRAPRGRAVLPALTASALTASGVSTGLFTSPHLHTVRERFRIDGAIAAPDAFRRGCHARPRSRRRHRQPSGQQRRNHHVRSDDGHGLRPFRGPRRPGTGDRSRTRRAARRHEPRGPHRLRDHLAQHGPRGLPRRHHRGHRVRKGGHRQAGRARRLGAAGTGRARRGRGTVRRARRPAHRAGARRHVPPRVHGRNRPGRARLGRGPRRGTSTKP